MKKTLLTLFLMIYSLGFSQTAAPTPPARNASDVISIFSGAYSDLAGTDFFPNWGQSTTYTQPSFGGDQVKAYSNINYQGWQFASPLNPATASMTNLHLDLWTTNCTTLKVFMIIPGQPERFVSVTPTFNTWNSVDIPLASFGNPVNNNVIQFKFESVPFGGPTIYLDNVYFWKSASTPTITGFSVPEQYIGTSSFTLTPPTSNSPGAFTYTSSNPSVATISGSTVTIVGIGTSTITATQAAAGGFDSGSTSAQLIVSYPPPTTNAPNPTDPAGNVISIFSDSYTNIAGTDFYPNWGQTTVVSNYAIAGNNIKKYFNLNYEGTNIGSAVNATTMTRLHIDVWTPNCTQLDIYPIVAGQPEQFVRVNPTLNTWNSFDIDLSQYTINLNGVYQFKLVGTNGSTLYFDNLYFSNAPLNVAPTLSNFSIPTKAIGDSDFNITAPTSNSTGAFTYGSSDTNVATVSGNTIHIVGTGTTIITANQAAAGIYTSGSITANFVVTIPAPTLSNFSVPAKAVGDPDFTLNPPNSNSGGTFSYSSSNTGVATISGDTVHIVGTGTTVITATQAADGVYSSGTITANLVVSPAMTSAPTPPVRQPANVISVYSNAYTDITGTVFNQFQGGAQTTTLATTNIGADTLLHYQNFNYTGIAFGAPFVDLRGMGYMHLDVYTSNCTSLRFYFIVGGVPNFKDFTLTQNSWNSFDYDLSLLGYSQAQLSTLQVLKLEAQPFGTSDVYIDNLYFWRNNNTPVISNFSVPAHFVGDAPFTLTPPTSNSPGAFSYTSSNTSVATVSGDVVTVVGAGSTTITANQAASAPYLAGSITATLNVTVALTTAAPTPPARVPANVVSIYSNAYTNVVGTVFNQFQGGAQTTTLTEPLIAGNNTLRYENFNYTGIAFGAPFVDVHNMTKMHFDLWSTNCTSLRIYFIVGGVPAFKDFSPTLNGWNSFEFNLSDLGYSAAQLSSLQVLKLEAQPFGTSDVYIDNLYFWKPDTIPTLSNFSVPTKVLGDAPFNLTAPTSNSTGTFSYSSSNTAVATISGNTVTIVGGGTTTITATQAAAAPYESASITAQFVVTFPPPMTAAPTPTVPASHVLSIFSDAYTNVTGTDFFPNWGQSTVVSTIQIAGNNTLKYANLNYEGTQFAAPFINASTMNHLHLDVYTPDCTFLRVYPIVSGMPEEYVELTPTFNSWNSFDISMSQYANPLNQIIQFKIVGSNGSTVYLDNIYFSDACPGFVTYYVDNDGDGYNSGTVDACVQLPGYVTTTLGTDCDDTNSAIYRNGSFYVDADNDGYYNGNSETTTVCYGATTPSGYVATINGSDCNDNNAEINANHVEVMGNGIDDNCDGTADETAPTSSMQPAQCGSTLINIAQAIYANQVSGAQGYRFEVTNGANVRSYDSATSSFNLLNLSGGATYATTYSVRVAVKTNGFWRAYTAACNITTPAVPATTNVSAAQCGITLNNIANTIYCNQVTSASQYRFEVTNGANVRTLDSAVNRFSLTSLQGGASFATTYSVRIALMIGGIWQDYGTACSITTPLTPGTSNVMPSQCGITISNSWTTIYATAVAEATGYRFEVVNGASTRYFDTPNARFNLHNLAGAAPAPSTAYTIRVAILFNGVYQPFGPACTITTAGAITRQAAEALTIFDVKAYPNPFAGSFKLDMNTSAEDQVEMKVYDMLGRLVEGKQLNVNELLETEMGIHYPAGVYNVVVTQGTNVKTLRVIKR